MLDRPPQRALAELQVTVVPFAPPALKRGHARFESDVNDPPERGQPGPEPVPLPALRLSPRLDIGSRSAVTCRILTFTSLAPRFTGIVTLLLGSPFEQCAGLARVRCGTCAGRVESLRARVLPQARQGNRSPAGSASARP
jgi:hypothetical protein